MYTDTHEQDMVYIIKLMTESNREMSDDTIKEIIMLTNLIVK